MVFPLCGVLIKISQKLDCVGVWVHLWRLYMAQIQVLYVQFLSFSTVGIQNSLHIDGLTPHWTLHGMICQATCAYWCNSSTLGIGHLTTF